MSGKNKQIMHMLEIEISKKETEIEKRDTEIEKREVIIERLKQKIYDIEHSITWKLLQKYERILNKYFPKSTYIRTLHDNFIKKNRKQIQHTDKKTTKHKTGSKKNPQSKEIDLSNFQLNFPEQKHPLVSIIVITFNNYAYTVACLDSILKYTMLPYELIIVDNHSTDKTIELLKQLTNVTVIRNNSNVGVGAGYNMGGEKAHGKYVLFLNNDTIVTEYWLDTLVDTLKHNKSCGATGSKLLNLDGTLQAAGAIIRENGVCKNYGFNDDPNKDIYNYEREVDYCPAACLLVRKELFLNIGGFDDRYFPGYYEDVDLCLKIKEKNLTTIYQPRSEVYHHEHGSTNREELKRMIRTNRIKFLSKWGEHIH